jgi:hypothetical protein
VWQFSGLLLVLSLYSCHGRELLVCWLFFTSIFVFVTLLILIGLLGAYAGERLTVWARATAGMTPVLVLAPATANAAPSANLLAQLGCSTRPKAADTRKFVADLSSFWSCDQLSPESRVGRIQAMVVLVLPKHSCCYALFVSPATAKKILAAAFLFTWVAAFGASSSYGNSYQLWPSTAIPAIVDVGPDSPVELGVSFTSDVNGYVTGIRFYKGANNTGTHVGNLWTSTGTLLASATFINETASGWQQVNFSNPVPISANTTYVASYHCNDGHYSVTGAYFATSGVDNPPLHALADTSSTPDGPFAYGSTSQFPTNIYNSGNYWVDVVFVASGTGSGSLASQLTSSATSLGFGSVLVGSQSSAKSITLTNSRTGNVSISQINVSGSVFAASGISVPLTLAAGQQASLSVTFDPTTTGTVAGSISVVSNASNSPATISLSGTSVQPALTVTPTSASFSSVIIGTSNSQTFTLSNPGSAGVTISQASIAGSGFSLSGLATPVTIPVGNSATFNAVFTPAATASVIGNISIVSNAPTSPASVSLSGSGVAATLTLGVSPTSLSFGHVSVGSSSAQNITVTNTGNSNVTISSITSSGAGFSASGVSANTTLTPGQSVTLSVSFAPTATGSVTGSVLVASNATNSPAIVTFSGSGVASIPTLPTCGKLNDTNVYTPPNYDAFTPPAKGQSYTDPVFGCTITRVTDAIAMGWVEATHFYNTVTAFNADDSYLFLYGSAPIIVDSSGNVVVSESNMPATNSSIMVWDTTNPKVIYYTDGNQFIKGTITGTSPNATVTPTVLATFAQYSSVVIPGDMDISSDGLHIWLSSASDMGGDSYTADVFLVTLNAGNGSSTSASEGAVLAGMSYHKLQIVPNNGVSVEGSSSRTIYSSNGTVYEVPGGGTDAHTDLGLDSSGKMVAASIWYAGTAQNGCPSGWGYSLLDLASNSVTSCLNDGIQNVGNASHNSARDTGAGHWIVFSDDDSGNCPSSSYWCFNNPTNMTGWTLYAGEILIWDGAGNTVRLAHHRSRSDESYWAQTRAAISRDGKYIAFDSNFNQSSNGANYTDVYVIGPLY